MIIEAVLLFVAVLLMYYWYNRPRGMPPGPRSYPFLGSGIPLDLKKAEEYYKKYGDIFRCEVGPMKIIYLCDYKLVKDALNKIEVADRPSFEGFHFMTDGREADCRYNLHDLEINHFVKLIKTMQEDSLGFFLLELLPFFKRILPQFVTNKVFGLERINVAVAAAKELFMSTVKTHKAQFDPAQAKSVIDQYLAQIDQKTDISEFFDELDLLRISFDLFGAGFDTTSNMLRWMCLYAANYPEVQKRVQEQIDEVLSRDEFPANKHKMQLPLVEAFIHEVLRLSSLVPFGVMRSTNADVQLAGYHIPKDSMIFGVAGICHSDPRYWKDPEEFRLERFLDEEGKFVSHREGFVAFGTGKRSCLGESLARMELSIFTAALLQNFTFSPPEGKQVDLAPAKFPMSHFSKNQDILISIRK